jgi:hypothetical protein
MSTPTRLCCARAWQCLTLWFRSSCQFSGCTLWPHDVENPPHVNLPHDEDQLRQIIRSRALQQRRRLVDEDGEDETREEESAEPLIRPGPSHIAYQTTFPGRPHIAQQQNGPHDVRMMGGLGSGERRHKPIALRRQQSVHSLRIGKPAKSGGLQAVNPASRLSEEITPEQHPLNDIPNFKKHPALRTHPLNGTSRSSEHPSNDASSFPEHPALRSKAHPSRSSEQHPNETPRPAKQPSDERHPTPPNETSYFSDESESPILPEVSPLSAVALSMATSFAK